MKVTYTFFSSVFVKVYSGTFIFVDVVCVLCVCLLLVACLDVGFCFFVTHINSSLP